MNQSKLAVNVDDPGRGRAPDRVASPAQARAQVAWRMERAAEAAMLTDPRGVIEYVNPAFEAMTGWSRHEAVGRTPAILKSGVHDRRFYHRLWRTLQAGEEFTDVLVNRRKDGRVFREHETIRPLFDTAGRIVHFLCSGREVVDAPAALTQPAAPDAATEDALAGLIDQAWFVERLTCAVRQAGAQADALVVAVIEFDDAAAPGPAPREAVQRRVAARLLGHLRAGDMLARLSDTRFGLLLEGLSREAAPDHALRALAQALHAPCDAAGVRVAPSLRLGAVRPRPGEHDGRVLIERAVAAMRGAPSPSEDDAAPRPADAPSPESLRRARRRSAAAEAILAAHEQVPVRRRSVAAGEVIFRAGQPFAHVVLVNAGCAKVMAALPDGREHVVSFKFTGDWLGFDGIATRRHACEAVAMDIGEVWLVEYEPLLAAARQSPPLLSLLMQTMSEELGHDREARLALASLPADARVARFLHQWADHLEQTGSRPDQFTLHLTRGDIGNYLGLRIESVSRAMTRLESERVIRLSGADRRQLTIEDPAALAEFSRRSAAG